MHPPQDLSVNNVHTAPETMEERLRMALKIVEKSPVVLFRRRPSPDVRLIYVSENIARFGYPVEAFLSGKITFKDLVHPEDSERIGEEIASYAEKKIGDYTQSYRIITKSDDIRWIEDTTTTERDSAGNIIYYQGTVVDITERVMAEEKLRENEIKFRRIVETASEGFVMTDNDFNIIDVNDTFCRMVGYERKEIMGKALYRLAETDFEIYLKVSAAQLMNQRHLNIEGTFLSKENRRIPVLLHGNSLKNDAGQSLGFVSFVTDLTLQKKSLMLAGEVQKSLLPKSAPAITGLDVAGSSIPCDEIGGDYYDYLQPPDNRDHPQEILTLVVGDIAGHGIDSALLMATARAVLRDRYAAIGALPDAVRDMNKILLSDFNPTNRFMTLFALQIDQAKRTISWVRAGHDPAIIYHPGDKQRFAELGGPGTALGVLDDPGFEEGKMQGIRPGTIIAIGTDGIWEAFSPSGMRFGKHRLKKIIQKNAKKPAAAILERVYESVYRFTQGFKPQDDITLVIVKLTDPETEASALIDVADAYQI